MIRSVRIATWTSGLPVSVVAVLYSPISAVRRSAVIDIGGNSCRERSENPLWPQQPVLETAQPNHAVPRHRPGQPPIGVGRTWNPAHQRDKADGLAVLEVGGLRLRQGQRRDVGQRGRDRKQEVRGRGQRILRLPKFV